MSARPGSVPLPYRPLLTEGGNGTAPPHLTPRTLCGRSAGGDAAGRVAVADAADRLDRVDAGDRELAAQVADVELDLVAAADPVAPDFVQQLPVAEHAAGVGGEGLEHPELGGREQDLGSQYGDP